MGARTAALPSSTPPLALPKFRLEIFVAGISAHERRGIPRIPCLPRHHSLALPKFPLETFVAGIFSALAARKPQPALLDITNYLPKFKPQLRGKNFLCMRPGAVDPPQGDRDLTRPYPRVWF